MPTSYLCLNVHVIFATKDRAPLIEPEVIGELHAYLGGTARGLGAGPMKVGGVADHVHMLLKLRGDQCPADLVREIKKASNAWMRESVGKRDFSWQRGYTALSVSQSDVTRIVDYIGGQEEHHRHVSAEDELKAILGEHCVVFNSRFFD